MLKKENLLRMAETRVEWCVSVYMPTGDTDAKIKRRRLRDLMFDAEKKLHKLGATPFQIARLLGPVEMILENPRFWENRTEGLAAFFTPESFAWYSLQYAFDDLVVVTDRFHLKPLLRNASVNERFYLLALSENRLRFFEASELGINEVHVTGIPRNLACFLNPAGEEGLAGKGNERAGRLLELFRRVDKAVTEYLKNEDAPLILAGAEQLHPIYHEANSYPHIVKVGISGDADKWTANQLLEKALPAVKPVFRRKHKNACEMFEKKLATGRASNNLRKIFAAAGKGRIETLFVPVGRQKWGTFDKTTGELQIHERAKPGDKDLLCVASTRTLRSGGEVFVVLPEQMPNNSLIAAVLRK